MIPQQSASLAVDGEVKRGNLKLRCRRRPRMMAQESRPAGPGCFTGFHLQTIPFQET